MCIIMKTRIQPVCRSRKTCWEHSRRSWSCQTPIKQRSHAGPTGSTKQDTKVCHVSAAVSLGHSGTKYSVLHLSCITNHGSIYYILYTAIHNKRFVVYKYIFQGGICMISLQARSHSTWQTFTILYV